MTNAQEHATRTRDLCVPAPTPGPFATRVVAAAADAAAVDAAAVDAAAVDAAAIVAAAIVAAAVTAAVVTAHRDLHGAGRASPE